MSSGGPSRPPPHRGKGKSTPAPKRARRYILRVNRQDVPSTSAQPFTLPPSDPTTLPTESPSPSPSTPASVVPPAESPSPFTPLIRPLTVTPTTQTPPSTSVGMASPVTGTGESVGDADPLLPDRPMIEPYGRG